ncbi:MULTISPECIES: MarR family winged helix-turn-helix transcriptional regulator [Cedecea]|jgi:MarR family transcriptional regulator for hemolysin|uniref:MarR family transcriptional regulator n=1 Tax=Cedecea neteri TaxID=158822 RepID=A0A089PYS3_9ENTR|nr:MULTISPECIES: MarR family transcriptional regulator [Cedecea]AIR03354.1 MarR family transcriptional regulator [Cedecea neteri]NWC62388.1 MarR family transcriptional regulator [Cedecea sp. P7760]
MHDDKYDIVDFPERPLGMRLAMLVRLWRGIVDDAVAFTGLTQSSWTTLMQLSVAGEKITVTDLARAQGIDLPPLTRTLAQLEKEGYVTRTPDEKDRRVKFISLTPAGQKAIKAVSETVERCQAQVAQGIPAQQIEQFSQTVNLLAANMIKIR